MTIPFKIYNVWKKFNLVNFKFLGITNTERKRQTHIKELKIKNDTLSEREPHLHLEEFFFFPLWVLDGFLLQGVYQCSIKNLLTSKGTDLLPD